MTMMMVAIAVAASILVYVWNTGLVSTLQGSGGQQIKDQLVMDAYQTRSASTWTLHLRNVGLTAVTVAAVYVDATPTNFVGVTIYNPGEAGVLRVDVSSLSLRIGAAYLVKIITKDGAIFPLTVTHGRQE